jgi:hypothetical protein
MKAIIISAMSTLSIFVLVLYASCSVDKCKDVSCKNGGSCKDGQCDCPSGYSGTSCEYRTCEKNNTAEVRFINKTGSSLTYEVLWDGSVITTIAPGVTSAPFTVAAGQHTLHFLIANSGSQGACNESNPVLATCGSMDYWCTK